MSTNVKLADQNQLYARFMFLCGVHGIVKPCRAVLQLLEEDEASRQTRLSRYADAMHTTLQAAANDEPTDTDEARLSRSRMVPLARRTEVAIGLPTCKVHMGTRSVMAFLDLLEDCPLMEVLDLTGVESLYAADAYKRCPSGNEVVQRLSQLMKTHPSLRAVRFTGNPVGSTAATWLLEAVRNNKRITELTLDADGVDHKLLAELKGVLSLHDRQRTALAAPLLPTALSPAILELGYVDRKTAHQRQQLRLILSEREAFLECSVEELNEMVSQAESDTLESVVENTLGLRGDGEHVFLIVSGALDVFIGSTPFTLQRGHFFGEPSEAVLFSGGRLVVKERGHAFRIPLACMGPCLARWAARVDQYYAVWKRVVALQSVPVWMLVQACYTASVQHYKGGEVLTPRQSPFAGLFFPLTGRFAVQVEIEPSKERQVASAVLSSSHVAAPSRVVPSVVFSQVFTAGDLFGEEAVMTHAKRKLYNHAVVAVPRGSQLVMQELSSSSLSLLRSTSTNASPSAAGGGGGGLHNAVAKENAAVVAAELRSLQEEASCLHVPAGSAQLIVDTLRVVLQVTQRMSPKRSDTKS